MNIYRLINEEDNEKTLKYVAGNKNIISQLYSYEKAFSSLINFSLKQLDTDNFELKQAIEIFFDVFVLNLLHKPTDLLSCLSEVKTGKNKLRFLNIVTRHRLVNEDFLISLGSNYYVFERLPKDLAWVEPPILKYGASVINCGLNNLRLKDICPVHELIDESLIEHLLGWAFEEQKLSDIDIKYLKDIYPKKYNTIVNLPKF